MLAAALRNNTQPQDKLVPYLLLAISIHAIALYFLKVPSTPVPQQPSSALEVYLSAPTSPHPQRVTEEPAPISPHEKAVLPKPEVSTPSFTMGTTVNVPHPEPITPTIAEVANPSSPSPPRPAAKPPRLSIQSMLDAASRISKEDSQYQPQPKSDSPALADRPVLPKLAAVLADKGKPTPGTTQYADGMVKVVTAYGTVYCTQATPNLAKTGPLDPENIPMTCP